MRAAVTALVLAAAIVLPGGSLRAAPGLRGIMRAWRDDARTTRDMVAGRIAFDDAAVRAILQGYSADAARIAAAVSGHGAAARDFRRRFEAFQSDARAALGDVDRPSALRADFVRVLNDCQSCHDVFNN